MPNYWTMPWDEAAYIARLCADLYRNTCFHHHHAPHYASVTGNWEWYFW